MRHLQLYEEEIKPLLFEIFRETEADAEALIEEYIKMYKSLDEDGDIPKRISEQQRRITPIRKSAPILIRLL